MKIESGVTPGGVMLANFYGSIEVRTACLISVEASIVLIARNYRMTAIRSLMTAVNGRFVYEFQHEVLVLKDLYFISNVSFICG